MNILCDKKANSCYKYCIIINSMHNNKFHANVSIFKNCLKKYARSRNESIARCTWKSYTRQKTWIDEKIERLCEEKNTPLPKRARSKAIAEEKSIPVETNMLTTNTNNSNATRIISVTTSQAPTFQQFPAQFRFNKNPLQYKAYNQNQ